MTVAYIRCRDCNISIGVDLGEEPADIVKKWNTRGGIPFTNEPGFNSDKINYEIVQNVADINRDDLQHRLNQWAVDVFGEHAFDPVERRDRFLEEALELHQACGGTIQESADLSAYVYPRPVGEIKQEAGGTLLTLAALCTAHGIRMMGAGEEELSRLGAPAVKQKIRAKHLNKPRNSPLPGQVPGEASSTHDVHLDLLRKSGEAFSVYAAAFSNCSGLI